MENENKELNTIEAESQDSAQPVVDGKKVLLRLRDVKQYFPVKKTKLREKQRYVRANDGISLDIFEGETLDQKYTDYRSSNHNHPARFLRDRSLSFQI